MQNRDHRGYFNIDHLRINGESLRASPDLIYQNIRISEVVIVEIKYSRIRIPTNLWPNIWRSFGAMLSSISLEDLAILVWLVKYGVKDGPKL